MSIKISCPISFGEVMDKLAVLDVKSTKIQDKKKREHVSAEREEITACLAFDVLEDRRVEAFAGETYKALYDVNAELWDVLESQREALESGREGRFVEFSKRVLELNDRRYAIKKKANEEVGSDIQEVKHYSTKEM